MNIISTHGLAFKKGYEESWRADGKNNLHNILDTVSIHYLDLFSWMNDDYDVTLDGTLLNKLLPNKRGKDFVWRNL